MKFQAFKNFHVHHHVKKIIKCLIKISIFVFSAVLVVCCASIFWGWFYSEDTRHSETFFTQTEDGWTLAISHYRPDFVKVSEKSGKPFVPVILGHGFNSNRYNFDCPDGPSLAVYLSKKGFDVWVPELRGAGLSEKPTFVKYFTSKKRYDWGIKDYLEYDIPTFLSFIKEKTGSSSLSWIGHSMGGLLIQAYLALHPTASINAAVTIAAPSLVKPESDIIKLNNLRWLAKDWDIIPVGFLERAFTPFVSLHDKLSGGTFYIPNSDPIVMQFMMANGLEVLSGKTLWYDFGHMVDTGVFGPREGGSYIEKLPEAPVPMLILGGTKDQYASPESVMAACKTIPDRKGALRDCRILGKSYGFKEDYGHVDLVAGKNVEAEVFPIIEEFLKQQNNNSL